MFLWGSISSGFIHSLPPANMGLVGKYLEDQFPLEGTPGAILVGGRVAVVGMLLASLLFWFCWILAGCNKTLFVATIPGVGKGNIRKHPKAHRSLLHQYNENAYNFPKISSPFFFFFAFFGFPLFSTTGQKGYVFPLPFVFHYQPLRLPRPRAVRLQSAGKARRSAKGRRGKGGESDTGRGLATGFGSRSEPCLFLTPRTEKSGSFSGNHED